MRVSLARDIKESILAETVFALGNQINNFFEERKLWISRWNHKSKACSVSSIVGYAPWLFFSLTIQKWEQVARDIKRSMLAETVIALGNRIKNFFEEKRLWTWIWHHNSKVCSFSNYCLLLLCLLFTSNSKMRASLARDIKESILAETVVALRNRIKNFLRKRNFKFESEIVISKGAVLVAIGYPSCFCFSLTIKKIRASLSRGIKESILAEIE